MFDEYIARYPENSVYELSVSGYCADEKAQVVVFGAEADAMTQNDRAHVTIATSEGVPPVYSNILIEQAHIVEVEKIVLSGRIEVQYLDK